MQFSTPPDLTTVALKDAKSSRFEAPWYGFYGLMLSFLNHWTKKDATIIYPQLPVRLRESVEIEDSDNELGEDLGDDDVYKDDVLESQDFHGSDSEAEKPSDLLPVHRVRLATPNTGAGNFVSARQYKELRSERIPDFCRKRYYLDQNGNIFATRLDLLVEIKKATQTENFELEVLPAILRQLQTQAVFAFAEDPCLSKIVCLGAAGPQWVCFRLQRPSQPQALVREIQEARRQRAELDGPFSPSDRGSLPRTPASKPRKTTVSGAEPSRYQFNPGYRYDPDALPVTHNPDPPAPEILLEGTFKDPSSEKERKWIAKLGKLLDKIDDDVAKSYQKKLRVGEGRHQRNEEDEIKQEQEDVSNRHQERQAGSSQAGGHSSGAAKKKSGRKPKGESKKQKEPEAQGNKTQEGKDKGRKGGKKGRHSIDELNNWDQFDGNAVVERVSHKLDYQGDDESEDELRI